MRNPAARRVASFSRRNTASGWSPTGVPARDSRASATLPAPDSVSASISDNPPVPPLTTQQPVVGQATQKIVTAGVYSFSRNPIYLGGAGMLAGLALAVNFPWGLIMLLPALAACQTILILPEERYLTQKFGGEYQQYRASVRRWVGRTRHHRSGAR